MRFPAERASTPPRVGQKDHSTLVSAAGRRGWRAFWSAGAELGVQAVEGGAEAEREAVHGCGGVVGGGGVQKDAQLGELRRDLSGFRHALAQSLISVPAGAAERPGERGRRGGAQGVAEHKREDGGRGLGPAYARHPRWALTCPVGMVTDASRRRGEMRLVEILLLLANLLTFVVVAVPLLRAARWTRYAAVIALLIAGARALVEGPRWQMVPAYALGGVFFLVWLRQHSAPPGRPAGRRRTHRLAAGLAVGLGVLGLAVSSVLPIIVPVFRFPHPTGHYAIGTLTVRRSSPPIRMTVVS